MNAESTSVQQYRRAVPGKYRRLTLVEAPRGQTKIVLHVEALRKHYGAMEAVAGVIFDLRGGEIFGLLGHNGAGKTTLLSMLATLGVHRAAMPSFWAIVFVLNGEPSVI
jgi:ABC-type glutathione transport system ATPase component